MGFDDLPLVISDGNLEYTFGQIHGNGRSIQTLGLQQIALNFCSSASVLGKRACRCSCAGARRQNRAGLFCIR
jgi:hypothetical protein